MIPTISCDAGGPQKAQAAAVTWIAPGVERSEDYPARRNAPEQQMLWLDWHRATLLRKCAGLNATQLATHAVPPSNLSLLGLVRHLSGTERGWIRQTFRAEQIPNLYYRPDAPDTDFAEEDPAGAEEDYRRYRGRVPGRGCGAGGRDAGRHLHLPGQDDLGAVDVAAPRGGICAPQRARRPVPRGHRRLGRHVSRVQFSGRPGSGDQGPGTAKVGPALLLQAVTRAVIRGGAAAECWPLFQHGAAPAGSPLWTSDADPALRVLFAMSVLCRSFQT